MIDRKGTLSVLGAYIFWGFFPIYLKALKQVPPVQLIAHRVVWAFFFLVFLLLIQRKWNWIRPLLTDPRRILLVCLSALFLLANWLVFIWAIQNDYMVEASLGYFLNPLLSISLGVILLREKLRMPQWVAIALAVSGVLYLTIQYGRPPWIALAIGGAFAVYGYLKKISALPAIQGLAMETAILLIPSSAYIIWHQQAGTGHLGNDSTTTNLLLFVGVMTAIPLLLFAYGAQRIPLATVGALQYIAPTMQFLLGVFLYGEPFPRELAIGYILVWIALIIFTIDSFAQLYKQSDK